MTFAAVNKPYTSQTNFNTLNEKAFCELYVTADTPVFEQVVMQTTIGRADSLAPFDRIFD